MLFLSCFILCSVVVWLLPKERSLFLKVIPYLMTMSLLLTFFLWREFNQSFLYLSSFITNTFLLGGTFLFTYLKNKKFIQKKEIKWTQILILFISSFLVFIGILLYISSQWAEQAFSNMTFDQMILALNQPLGQAESSQIFNFLLEPLLNSLLLSSFVGSVFYFFANYAMILRTKKEMSHRKIFFPSVFLMSILILIGGISLSIKTIGYADIKAYYFEETKLYENEYVDPREVDLVFPEKKRNLIYIFLESMENSYASQDFGGVKANNLIPNLTQLALNEGIQFSNINQLGGMYQLPGTNQTASAMVAQTAGLPLRASGGDLDVNTYGKKGTNFFPGAYSLGEILADEGYNQMLFIGSWAGFAGRDKYFKQHGNYEVRDVYWARDQGLIPKDYWEWWGYEDRKLFDFAKDSLTELANQAEPFNFTMLTTDTHFEDGYATEETPNRFNDQYSNVIYDSDRQVKAFLEWIKSQPFYEETTVVIVGDHLTMDRDFFDADDPNYQRTIYNVFLNSPIQPVQSKNRILTSLDLFPTTLAALGVEVKGERLALGVNLFSSEPTLAEKIGFDNLYQALMQRSDFYDQNLMQGTDEALMPEESSD